MFFEATTSQIGIYFAILQVAMLIGALSGRRWSRGWDGPGDRLDADGFHPLSCGPGAHPLALAGPGSLPGPGFR